jgi:cyclopropane-fatty-acyl-phospholipid synthase
MNSQTEAARVPGLADSILDRLAWRVALAAAGRIQTGHLAVVLPDGSRRMFGDRAADLQAEIHIHDSEALARMLLHGETGGGEAYMDGLWSSPDLAALLRLAALNRESLSLSSGWFRVPAQVRRTVAHRARRNTRPQSRRNIAAHYDLGNEFYRLFLDETMTYSSAVFATPDQSLADAQRNKYRLIAEGAGLSRGQHVLEIGSGWGGFAVYAAGELGCRVTSITISQRQHDLARERVRAAGLEDLVDIQLRDYREIDGTYDAIVSIEMLEAVGAEYFETFFRACDAALVPGGRLSLQSITFPDATYERQLRGANWIQTYIFPGGLCPSLAVIERATHDTRLLITGVTDIGADYVRTLRAWRTRFMEQTGAVRSMGFDDRFVRMWEYYLALCEAGFATGISQDLQIVFEKRRGIAGSFQAAQARAQPGSSGCRTSRRALRTMRTKWRR